MEEFGYQHISTGDLLRIEMDRVSIGAGKVHSNTFVKQSTESLFVSSPYQICIFNQGTPEGQDIKNLMADGQLVPNQLTI